MNGDWYNVSSFIVDGIKYTPMADTNLNQRKGLAEIKVDKCNPEDDGTHDKCFASRDSSAFTWTAFPAVLNRLSKEDYGRTVLGLI